MHNNPLKEQPKKKFDCLFAGFNFSDDLLVKRTQPIWAASRKAMVKVPLW